MFTPVIRSSCLIGAVVLLLALCTGSAQAVAQGPALTVPVAKLASALNCPARFANSGHEPVLLVHGTNAYSSEEWGWSYVPALTSRGYDVCTVDLPNYALDDVQVSAEYVVYGVRFMAAHSHRKVDLLGASQGGIEPRWAVRWWPDVRGIVDDLVMIAAPNHGVGAHPSQPFRCIPACWQLAVGSNFLRALNSGAETPGAISYTSIYSQFDEFVQPNATSVLHGASNIMVQSLCPGRPVEHLGISSGDAVAFGLAVDAFAHPGPANPLRFDKATCAKAWMDGAQPRSASGGSRYFNQQPQYHWTDHEPPLKAYAR
jgi:pimeloyl-ACP methyl ester carboxylesterase